MASVSRIWDTSAPNRKNSMGADGRGDQRLCAITRSLIFSYTLAGTIFLRFSSSLPV